MQNKATGIVEPQKIEGGISMAAVTPGRILNAHKAANILGIFTGDGKPETKDTTSNKDKISILFDGGQLTEVGELYADLGAAITGWQNDLPYNASGGNKYKNENVDYIAKDEKAHKTNIDEKITYIANKIHGVKKDGENLAISQVVAKEEEKKEAAKNLANDLIGKFHEAKKDPKSALHKSTMNQTKIQVEYRDKIKNEKPIKPSQSFKGNDKYDDPVNQAKWSKDGRTVKMKARTKSDGRLMALMQAEKNGFDPTASYTLTLEPFTTKSTKEQFFALDAAVGFMREHREYGAGANVALGKGEPTLTFENFATHKENAIVKYNNSASWLGRDNFFSGNKTNNPIKTTMELSVCLIMEDAKKEVLQDATNGKTIDPSNRAMMNLAIREKIPGIIKKAKETAKSSEGAEGAPKSMFYTSDSWNESYINNDLEKELTKMCDKELIMSPAEIAQMKDLDVVINDNKDKDAAPFDHTITCDLGDPVAGGIEEGPTLKFDSNQKLTKENITAEQKQAAEAKTMTGRVSKIPGQAIGVGGNMALAAVRNTGKVVAAVTFGSLGAIADSVTTIVNPLLDEEKKFTESMAKAGVEGSLQIVDGASKSIKAGAESVGGGIKNVAEYSAKKAGLTGGWLTFKEGTKYLAGRAYHSKDTQSKIGQAYETAVTNGEHYHPIKDQATNFAENLAGKGLNLETSEPTKEMIQVQTDKITKRMNNAATLKNVIKADLVKKVDFKNSDKETIKSSLEETAKTYIDAIAKFQKAYNTETSKDDSETLLKDIKEAKADPNSAEGKAYTEIEKILPEKPKDGETKETIFDKNQVLGDLELAVDDIEADAAPIIVNENPGELKSKIDKFEIDYPIVTKDDVFKTVMETATYKAAQTDTSNNIADFLKGGTGPTADFINKEVKVEESSPSPSPSPSAAGGGGGG
ncbi:MAG: hypothetical protein HON55_02535 [Legionellales bacterium]|jgi:hypothetical protein|nr:hypothetical protein [Legionellales bacterium]